MTNTLVMEGRVGTSTQSVTDNLSALQRYADWIRFQGVYRVHHAGSGHAGSVCSNAELLAVLLGRYVRINVDNPFDEWRDRFGSVPGHDFIGWYAALAALGYGFTVDDLQSYRTRSGLPSHNHRFAVNGSFEHPHGLRNEFVEWSSGDLGSPLGYMLGIELHLRRMAELHGSAFRPVDIIGIAGDGDLAEGIQAEVADLAAFQRLSWQTLIFSANGSSLACVPEMSYTQTDYERVYEAYGWRVLKIEDGHCIEEIDAVLAQALLERDERPVFVLARTEIGHDTIRAGDRKTHSGSFGDECLRELQERLRFSDPNEVPAEVQSLLEGRRGELAEYFQREEAWQETDSPDAASIWSPSRTEVSPPVPVSLLDELIAAVPQPHEATSTRLLSQQALRAAARSIPGLVAISPDVADSTLQTVNDSRFISPSDRLAQDLEVGARERAAGTVANGISYAGGRAVVGLYLGFSNFLQPDVDGAARAGLPTIFSFTHDSLLLGGDAETHTILSAFVRFYAMSNFNGWRPAYAREVAIAWHDCLSHKGGPSGLFLSRQDLLQNLPEFSEVDDHRNEEIRRGGYIIWRSQEGSLFDLLIVSSGSELAGSILAGKKIHTEYGCSVAVVSLPNGSKFSKLGERQRHAVIHPASKRVVFHHAGRTFGIERILGVHERNILLHGLDDLVHWGSGPVEDLWAPLRFRSEDIVEDILSRWPELNA